MRTVLTDVKKIMCTMRRAPHGSIYVQEGLEAALIVAAYGAEVSLVFMDDGVFALKRGQDTEELGTKGFAAAYGALMDHDIQCVLVDRHAMKVRGMTEADLLSIGQDAETGELRWPRVVEAGEIAALMAEQHSILSF